MTPEALNQAITNHALWLSSKGGSRANLREANMRGADLSEADLSGANLSGADLREACLSGANLIWANLRRADLSGADLSGAYLSGANLREANMRGADLLCQGNMSEIRTMQIDKWAIGYTADTLQIGCQRHPIDKWRRWGEPAGRKWVEKMDTRALEWADRNLNLVLAIIDANPATSTGHESEGKS